MRPLSGMLLFAVASLISMNCASAGIYLSPPSTNFQIKGLTTITLPSSGKDCQLTLVGSTAASPAKKGNAGSFSSASTHSSGCRFTFLGFPWNITLTSKAEGLIENVTYTAFEKLCGPENVAFTVSKKGVWQLNGGQDDCTLFGYLKSSPSVTIAH
jgi:hypothetical protein